MPKKQKTEKRRNKDSKLFANIYKRLAYIFLFVYNREKQIIRHRITYIIIIGLSFIQISSILVTISDKQRESIFIDVFFLCLEYSRIVPLLSLFESDFTIIIAGLLVFFFQVYILVALWQLSTSSVQQSDNVSKQKEKQIQIVTLFFELYEWIFIVPVLNLLYTFIFCGEFIDTELILITNLQCKRSLSLSIVNSQVFWIIFFVANIIMNIILGIFQVKVYYNPQFNSKKLLKSSYMPSKFLYQFLLNLLIIFSFIEDAVLFTHIIAHLIGVFLIIVYINKYPLIDIKITKIYLWLLLSYEVMIILQTLREFTDNFLKDQNFVDIFMILLSLIYGVSTILINNLNHTLMAFDIGSYQTNPENVNQYLQLIYDLFLEVGTNQTKKIQLLGILNQHQVNCKDNNCPCQIEEDDQLLDVFEGQNQMDDYLKMEQNQKKNDQEKNEKIYLYSLQKNVVLFQAWVFNFIDYHYYQLLQHLLRMKNQQLLEKTLILYWFFIFECKDNYIQALFKCKTNMIHMENQSVYFKVLEQVLSYLIENKVKENDKAALYSKKIQEIEEAKMLQRFEILINSYQEIKNLKQNLINLVQNKIDWYNTLIKGYKKLNMFYEDCIKQMTDIQNLEKKIHILLADTQNSIYGLKLMVIIKARLLNDPVQAFKYQQQINEIKRIDKNLNKNTINSLTLIDGKAASMIASFRTQQGKIIQFSERLPNLFKFEYNEFKNTIDSVKKLIPDCIAQVHDEFITRLIEDGTPKILRGYRPIMSKGKDGYIISMKLYVNFFFQIQEEFAFSALFLKEKTDSDFILIDEQGYIQGTNRKFAEFSGINCVSPFEFSDIHISLLIPDFYRELEKSDFNLQSDKYIKYSLHLPPKEYMDNFINDFRIHHSALNEIENSCQEDWKYNLDQFILQREDYIDILDPQYDIICNIVAEKIQLYSGQQLILYILEIEQYVQIEKFNALKNESVYNVSKNTKQIKEEEFETDDDMDVTQGLNSNYNSRYKNIENQDQDQLVLSEDRNNLLQSGVLELTTVQDGDNKQFANDFEINRNYFYENQDQNQINIQTPNSDTEEKINIKIEATTLDPIKNVKNFQESALQIQNQNQQQYYQQDLNVSVNDSQIGFNQQNYNNDNNLVIQNNNQNNEQQNINQQDTEQNGVTKDDDNYFKDYNGHDQNIFCYSQDEDLSKYQSESNIDYLDYQQTVGMTAKFDNSGNYIEQGEIIYEKHQTLGENQLGINQSSIVKQIQLNVKDKTTPQEIQLLYMGFTFQILIFIIITITVQLFFNNSLYHYMNIINQSGIECQFLHPIAKSSLTSNIIALQNDLQYQNQQNTEDLNYFIQDFIKTMYDQFKNVIDESMDQQVEYKYQKEYINLDLSNIKSHIYGKEQNFEQIKMSEFFKLISENFYQYQDKNVQKTMDFNSDIPYLINQNLQIIYDNIYKVDQALNDDILDIQDTISYNNILSFIGSIILLILSFTIIIPGFQKLKVKIKKLCMIISRISEKDAQQEQVTLKQIIQIVKSNEETYLISNYYTYKLQLPDLSSDGNTFKDSRFGDQSQFKSKIGYSQLKSKIGQSQIKSNIGGMSQLKNMNNTKFGKSQAKSKVTQVKKVKKQKNNQNILGDRIQYQDLNFIKELGLLLVLFCLGISFFIVVFFYIKETTGIYKPIYSQFKDLEEATGSFSISISAHTIVYMQYIKGDIINDNQLLQLENFRDENIQKTINFFTKNYTSISLDSDFYEKDFKNYIKNINTGNLCENESISQFQHLCTQSQEGLLQRGLQLSVKQILNNILNQEFQSWDRDLIENYVFSQEYDESRINTLMIINIFNDLQQNYVKQNKQLNENKQQILFWITMSGIFVYLVIFTIFSTKYLSHTLDNYYQVKFAIQFIPYKQLSENQTIIYLLKNVFNI